MTAESTLVRLISSPQPRAVALIGGWGRGKTHLWRNLVESTPHQPRAKYSYVSLFGVNSLEDLKLAIFQREIDAGPPLAEPTWWERIKSKVSGRAIVESATQIENPWLNNLNALYRTIAFSQVRERLICLDDLERRGKDLNLEEVLGLVTFLCEERQCAVVLILNDTTMDGIDDWNKYREKVFNAEVTYRPSSEMCIDIILGTDVQNEWYRGARHVLMQLDVSNMRIMTRVKDAIAPLTELFPAASGPTQFQIGATLALYVYCHNASGEGAPPMDRALAHNRFAFAMSDGEHTEEEKRWEAILSKVDFYPDELDLAVTAYVRDGYPDVAAFTAQVARMESAHQANSADQAFTLAWESYHNSFDDNSEDVIAKFAEAFPAAASTMHAMNANSSIALMRQLGQDQLADAFIANWIAPRRGARRRELSLHEAQIFGPLTDAGFISALDLAEREETTEPDLDEALDTVARGQGSLDRALHTISRSDLEEVVHWFERNPGRTSRTFITTSMQFQGGEHVAVAQRRIRSALETLAERSPINSVRVSAILRAIDGY
ncbi:MULTISPECIES: hypothetical protein [Stenotrophomonas]|uniref:hypothetical protein n=1 Tax=Stenotrophomonas TaxID=40323 RepID=UPI0018D3453C|nr:hypothetical protein [Stenotrophomonas sp.]MBH1507245.1 hypothetical protein [Stenotrophomonas maltophilia]